MFEKHCPSNSYPDTLFLTYVAKRRAEVAPFVGKDTDLCLISLKDGYVELSKELDALKNVYDNIIGKAERETAELKIPIQNIMIKAQDELKAKEKKYWEEKIRKWELSG